MWFVTARPGVATVLIGTSSARHLTDGMRYLRTPAPEPVLRALASLSGERAPDEPGARSSCGGESD
jgi:aryl-alcohol dehydrogenase-like predicted oxidoreductase